MLMREWLQEPLVANVEHISEDRIKIHRAILDRKKMIRDVFREFHIELLAFASRHLNVSGIRIELGAGVHPLKLSDPSVVSTDIVPAEHLDRTLNSQQMDLEDHSVGVLFGQNCFHHFDQPELFFKEADRVLKIGGGIVLIEPHHGLFAQLLYKRLFSAEGYDLAANGWGYLKQGQEALPNQALSYVVLLRDRAKLSSLFPNFEIVEVRPATNWVRYLVSGGLNFRQLLPDFCIPALKLAEGLLSPLGHFLALHTFFVLKKVR